MRMLNEVEKKSELHIYSLVLLGITLCVIAAYFLHGDSFGFATALIGFAGVGASMSERWKNAGDTFHNSVMITSVVVMVGVVVFNLLFPREK